MSRSVPAANVRIKRAYEPAAPEDGSRVLVDRLWPRGVSKGKARLDSWLQQVAPGTGLRKWFGHDPRRWIGFRRRYRSELEQRATLLRELRRQARAGPVTLVYAAKDGTHNEAVVLRNVILGRPGPQRNMP